MQRLKRLKKSQSGFTLVEISIVLVIIGLLIGGVLKGQAMVQNAKVKRVVFSQKDPKTGFNGRPARGEGNRRRP